LQAAKMFKLTSTISSYPWPRQSILISFGAAYIFQSLTSPSFSKIVLPVNMEGMCVCVCVCVCACSQLGFLKFIQAEGLFQILLPL
jgi:hypothetical protein